MTFLNMKRRKFLVGGGAAALFTKLSATALQAQPRPAPGQSNESPIKVLDFHSHFVGPSFNSIAGRAAPAAAKAYWEQVNRNLSQPDAVLSSIEMAGIAGRVVNTPLEFLQESDAEVAPDLPRRINDHLAEFAERNSGRVYALATVDAYAGDAGAHELARAVRELGLRGVFVQAAKGDMFLDAPQARATLTAAADLGVPVFVHPISDAQLRKRFASYGRLGVTFNRGTVNGAALVALLESGAFDQLPKLKIVVTTLAMGGVLMAGGFGNGHGLRSDAPEVSRRHVYIDTMGLHPVLIRAAVDLLGADHVLAGTDWPIFVESHVPERLQTALSAAGLTAADQQLVASGNALRLLGRV